MKEKKNRRIETVVFKHDANEKEQPIKTKRKKNISKMNKPKK